MASMTDSPTQNMQCMEVWGGSQLTSSGVELARSRTKHVVKTNPHRRYLILERHLDTSKRGTYY
jgi:hypothetical protein